MSDLPRAEEQARAVAEAMKQAGLAAHEQAGALEGQLAALAARGREADEVVGGAAQRLGAHIARIESGAGAAAERMDQAAAQMNARGRRRDGRAPRNRSSRRAPGLEAQGQAMLAMIEQSRAAFEQAGAETTRGLAERLDVAGQQDRDAGRPAGDAGRRPARPCSAGSPASSASSTSRSPRSARAATRRTRGSTELVGRPARRPRSALRVEIEAGRGAVRGD